MAKNKNLMGNFNLRVSSEDLKGPATLPDYFDSDPLKSFKQVESQQVKEPQKIALPKEKPVLVTTHSSAEKVEQTIEVPKTPTRNKSLSKPQRRLQINLTGDIQNKTSELIEMMSSQRDESEIKITEIVHAMVLQLYQAKNDIDLSRIPLRGRWGSQTAKSFAPALGEAFREAIVNCYLREGGSSFKKVVGG